MKIDVVRAWPRRFELVRVDLPAGATVADAVAAAGWGEGGEHAGLAVFGQRVAEDAALRDGDRVVLIRPLQADP